MKMNNYYYSSMMDARQTSRQIINEMPSTSGAPTGQGRSTANPIETPTLLQQPSPNDVTREANKGKGSSI
jgi:hypothetical protein